MKILKNELKKIFTSPIIIGLVVVFTVFNLFVITKNFRCREDLLVLNKIVKNVGYKIDDNMLVNFKNYYDDNLKEANKIINSKSGNTYKTISEFFTGEGQRKFDSYNKEEQGKIIETSIIENYYLSIKEKDIKYEKIDMGKVADEGIAAYKLSGEAAETVKKNYKEFQKRLDEIKANGEQRSLFFEGKAYPMHDFLYNDILRDIIFEVTLLGCLIMLFIVNYEFDNSTSLLVYTTKRGRNLVKDKLLAGIIGVVLVTTVILGITLLVYFSIFSYEGLWNVPVSSYFNWEIRKVKPFISWFSLNTKQYLILSIALVYAIQLIFSGITFLIVRIAKNTYIGFFIFLMIIGGGILIPTLMPRSSNLVLYSNFTPFNLLLNPKFRFMESGPFITFKYYELITILIWGSFIIPTNILSIKKFKREALN